MHGQCEFKLLEMKYCFDLLTPSSDSVPKTGVLSDIFVEKKKTNAKHNALAMA